MRIENRRVRVGGLCGLPLIFLVFFGEGGRQAGAGSYLLCSV
jgi:hypothetical protein